ncbi:peptidase S7 [Anoxybacter fermentans]|uniref:Peptidase S7 n=1 Tax=Anoxybacter fermentans TaxID=1323375 RepID=A0A3Q9HNX3_9FIRM|nr:peptidase S7 [Anoxybacter fermentans]AZR72335.1 peptidase S7 [Anoxybacter fermentans]
MKIQGIAKPIVERMVERSNELGQGRGVGAIGLINEDGYITACSEIVDGGISGIPFRQLLSKLVNMDGRSLLEGINQLADNIALLFTSPGSTGVIVSTGAINLFDVPVVNIGIKSEKIMGIGILYPKKHFFDLATRSEQVQIDILGAKSMEEERQLMKASTELRLEYLDISEELPMVEMEESNFNINTREWKLKRLQINSIDKAFVDALVAKSSSIEQGREVAAMGLVDENGHVVQKGEIVVGGMGYVPSRLLASSYTDISGKSLRRVYTEQIPDNAVIVHTHPGGTGVMHMGDAMAGPGTWGRPIIAIGHNQHGEVRGATVIELDPRVAELADEYEEVGQKFFLAKTPQEEAEIRKKRFAIAQEYTDLCKPIEIK